MREHIHLVNTHGIGDVIMSLPVIESVLSSGFKLSMLVKSNVEAEVIKTVLNLSEDKVEFIYFQNLSKEGVKGYLKILKKLRSLNIDLIIPSHSVNINKYNLIALFSKSKVRAGQSGGKFNFNHINYDDQSQGHKVEVNYAIFDFILSEAGYNFKPCINLTIPSYHKTNPYRFIDKYERGVISIAPGSGVVESHKRWPIEKYAELIELLLRDKFTIAILGGPGEEELAESIMRLVDHSTGIYNFTGKLKIKETMDVLYESDFLVSNCNGISHMASAIEQIKIIGIYGPTNFKITGAYSDNFFPQSLNLKCSPCYNSSYVTGCGNPICMLNINAQDIHNAIREVQ
tara:strand:- start:3697 stop:4728 length:1032 start_codon:yes stop_codon:yes gene_type:complete